MKENHINELKQIHNHICMLYDFKLVRLIGFGEDDEDYYYVVKNRQGKIWWASCVGWCYSIKHYLPEERYSQTENIFNLNGGTPEEEFLVAQRKGICQY